MGRRRLDLYKGEAHFKVFYDPSRPFEVYVGERLFRAVGTAFSVFKNDKRVKVIVTEGKVDIAIVNRAREKKLDINDSMLVTNEAATPSIFAVEVVETLDAGQSIVITSENNATVSKVTSIQGQELRRQLSWMDGKLVFSGKSLGEVVSEVSRYTDISIKITDPDLNNIRIGGQFQVGKVDALFDVLESSFGLNVTHLDDRHVRISPQ